VSKRRHLALGLGGFAGVIQNNHSGGFVADDDRRCPLIFAKVWRDNLDGNRIASPYLFPDY
jgi:hypothetical protein